MKVYRTGRHWGVTIVEEDMDDPTKARLIAMATSMADAENICEAMNLVTLRAERPGWEATP